MNKEIKQILKNQQTIMAALWTLTNDPKAEEKLDKSGIETMELLNEDSRSKQ